jgi:hypothetical protein
LRTVFRDDHLPAEPYVAIRLLFELVEGADEETAQRIKLLKPLSRG